MSKGDLVETDCPTDVVDRLLWRNAQRILHRHVVRLDGTCHWCGRRSPCAPRELAERADAVSRLPWHEAWAARNEITRMLPVITADLSAPGSGPARPAGATSARSSSSPRLRFAPQLQMPLAVAVRAPPPAPTVPHDPLAHAAGMPPPVDASGQAYIRVAPSGPGG